MFLKAFAVVQPLSLKALLVFKYQVCGLVKLVNSETLQFRKKTLFWYNFWLLMFPEKQHTNPRFVIIFWFYTCCQSLCAQLFSLCLTLCNPMDYSPPGSFVRGISPARILEWVAISISFSRGSSQPRDWTQVSCIKGSLLHCRQFL